jgi:hypothetical protein
MIKATLKREYLDLATLGTLHVTDEPICSILELPWKDNAVNESCIPEGMYIVEPYESPKFGKCFIVKDVKGRTYILIHKGNYVHDTDGCLLPGLEGLIIEGLDEKYNIINGAWVRHSAKAMALLFEKFTEPFELTIVEG